MLSLLSKKIFSVRIIVLLLSLFTLSATAQNVIGIPSISADKDFGYLTLKNFYSDSNATTDIVWIKGNEMPHKHLHHSEFAYILEGTGMMLIGDSVYPVKPGDFIEIPPGVVHAVRLTSSSPMKAIVIHAPQYDGKDKVEVNMKWPK